MAKIFALYAEKTGRTGKERYFLRTFGCIQILRYESSNYSNAEIRQKRVK